MKIDFGVLGVETARIVGFTEKPALDYRGEHGRLRHVPRRRSRRTRPGWRSASTSWCSTCSTGATTRPPTPSTGSGSTSAGPRTTTRPTAPSTSCEPILLPGARTRRRRRMTGAAVRRVRVHRRRTCARLLADDPGSARSICAGRDRLRPGRRRRRRADRAAAASARRTRWSTAPAGSAGTGYELVAGNTAGDGEAASRRSRRRRPGRPAGAAGLGLRVRRRCRTAAR